MIQKNPELKISIPQPPQDIFRHNLNTITQIMQEKQSVFILDRVEYPEEGGIYVYLKDVLFPTKGFPTPQAISAINLAKRFFIGYLSFFGMKEVIFSFGLFILLPWTRKIKVVERWLHGYSALGNMVLMPYYMKDRFYAKYSRAIEKFIQVFLKRTGIREDVADEFAKVFANLIEYDTAYRYRIQDIMSETTHTELYDNPRKEIKRLLMIFKDREPTLHLVAKFESLASIITILLALTRVKRAFRDALDEINIRDLQLDEADRYHILRLDRYNFLGKPLEERFKEYVAMHNGTPPIPVQIQAQT